MSNCQLKLYGQSLGDTSSQSELMLGHNVQSKSVFV